jgi:hypothetical protein
MVGKFERAATPDGQIVQIRFIVRRRFGWPLSKNPGVVEALSLWWMVGRLAEKEPYN